jgi:hypothetical protein
MILDLIDHLDVGLRYGTCAVIHEAANSSTKRMTLRFTRTLTRLKHSTKRGSNVLAYAFMKNYEATPAQIERLAQFLSERMRQSRRACVGALRAGHTCVNHHDGMGRVLSLAGLPAARLSEAAGFGVALQTPIPEAYRSVTRGE